MKHLLLALLATLTAAHADPQLTSWFTANTGQYARIYTTTTNRTNGVSTPTWTGQTSPVYAGVNEVNYSTSWVYIRNSGMASFVMGPWNNPNLAKNQAGIWRFPRGTAGAPTVTGQSTLTSNGAIGFLVDGVAVYNTSDGFSYSFANLKDATPNGGIGAGDGIWNRDAFPNEFVSFDYALSHNPPSGEYHSHANAIGTRYVLGDNVTYDSSNGQATSKQYQENTANTNPQHSPIIGWMKDGLPLYGPYGYDGGSTGATANATVSGGAVTAVNVVTGGTLYQNPPLVTFTGGGGSGAAATAVLTGGVVTAVNVTNGGSGYTSAPTVKVGGVRRMISGYQLRDGTNGSTNIVTASGTTTLRTSLPVWSLAARTTAPNTANPTLANPSQYGPATTYTTTGITYTIGHFAEDYAYLGDSADFGGNTYVQGSRSNANGVFFDLNKYNTRFCVTPEYPNGTWAYFMTIKADGTSFYPYSVGRWYYGNPSGGATTAGVMNADTPLTQQFIGGANLPLTIPNTPTVTSGTVSLTWTSGEGGTYSVDASTNQSSGFVNKVASVASGGIATSSSYAAIGSSGTEYARVNRTALATYDSAGQTASTVAQTSPSKSYSAGATNTAPTISAISSQSTLQNTATGAIAFTIGDTETAAASLTVSGASSNTTLVPNANIAFGGSGANRTVTITPANGQTGTSTITVTVSDGALTADSGFTLTVTANTPPTISSISAATVVKNNATSAISFTVGDTETAPASLTVSATSSNTVLVPNANITFGGSGAGRTVTVTPALGQIGTATITVTVSDGTTTTSTTFTITVKPPNILLIIADDFGLDASAVYNPTGNVAPTPKIASLATGGLRFNKAYAYTVCSPTRSSMLTGRYGFRTGTANVAGGVASNNSLKATEFTLPEAFAAPANSGLNYQLKHIGKWHLGGGNTAPGAIGGWPAFAGFLAGQVTDYYSWPKVITDGTAGGTTTPTSTVYTTTDQVNDAVSFINTQTAAGKPWFTWVALNAPHITQNSPFYQMPPTTPTTPTYPTDLCPNYSSLPNTTADILARPIEYYNATVQAMDTEIGRLLDSVDLTKTDVIFIGDNGTANGVLQAPYPGNKGKATLAEGGIRVPMIIRGPDVVVPGRTTDVLTHVVDLYATILEMAGINVASTTAGVTLDSQSLLPVLQNQSVTRNYVFGDYWDLAFPTLSDAGRVIRDVQYKLVRLNDGTERFYDLSADPYEATNLIAGGFGSMNSTRQAAYTSLSNQLATYNTPPTITAVANQTVSVNTATAALPFTIGDAELNTSILSVSSASSNTVLVPSANVVIGGTNTSRTVTVTPATGQTGVSTITLSVTDGTFTTNTSFTVTAGTLTTVSNIATNPSTPTNTDNVTLTANVSPASGRTISGVQLTYNTAAQVTGPVFREIFANASTAGTTNNTVIPGNMNSWTATTVRNAADVKLRSGTANHTVPIVLATCTTDGSATVTCTGATTTAGLIPGMSISGNIAGTYIPTGTTIQSVTNATSFALSASVPTSSGASVSLTAAGVTLTGCSASASTVTCASTVGLSAGMVVTGTGIVTTPPNTAVVILTIPTTTMFTFAATTTITTCPATLTASGCGLELSTGTATFTDTMATTTNAINASTATAGNVEFYVRTSDLVSNHGWIFQISPDGGATWNPRLSESFASGQLSACTLNGTATIACSDTTGLAVGGTVQGAAVQVANCVTSTATNPTVVLTPNTGSLAVGMFVNGPGGSGIPQNSRITAINPGVSFTINNSVTVTNASPGINLTANYIAPNATITAVTANSFTVNPQTFYTGTVSLVNHSFMLKHYNLVTGDMTANMKMRFQWSGSTVTAPARPPTCDIDDVVVTLTTGAAPGTITMFDDGAHGDGGAGDGVYGTGTQAGQFIPAQAQGAAVSYTITATDSAAATATGSGNYLVVAAAPVLAVTPNTTLSASGAASSGVFTPSSIAYTVTNTGTGTMSWTAAKTQSWLNLSATSGTLTAGAGTTVTASIHVANANALSANTYNDTITFTNGYNGTGNTTRAASLLVTNGNPTAPAPPVLATLPLFSAGASKTVSWPAVATATSYTLQIASSANFTTNLLSSQTVATPYGTFANLADGVTYFYRVLATNNVGSSAYSNTVSTTQDTVAPTVVITSPSAATTQAANTITVTGTASDARSGISGVKVNNVAATSGSNFATWSATVPLGFGGNAITATATDGAGNQTTTAAVIVNMTTFQTYNPLIIPDSILGTTFNLDLYQTNKRFPTWTATNPTLGINPSTTLGSAPGTTTLGYNGMQMWGPTLIMNKGDTVRINVANHLDQSSSTLLRSTTTTVHWHGFHIPAIMDGGPRQVIAAGTTWSPIFQVKNDAATFWYHPHLHMATQEQLTLGAGGMIIVRDPVEAALNLPRTYGVDDFPLAVTTRRFLSPSTTNEFSANQYAQADGSTSTTDNYGDYVLVNGTMNPQVSLPKQFVRLRILCADIQRGYRIGFSDNRNFYVIGNDQGLLNTPQLVSQVTMMIGERVEILVDLSGDTIGSSLDLMAWDNLGAAGGLGGSLGGFGGSESNSAAPNGNVGRENGGLLCNSDFKLVHINIAAPTANAVTSVSTTLANNTYLTAADATTNRTINISNGNGGTPGFTFDGMTYSPTTNNFNIPLNAIEKWTFNGGQVFGHSIHIHDIKFKVVGRSVTQTGANTAQIFDTTSSAGINNAILIGTKPCADYESGWKDTLYVPRGESVSVVAKYDDFASPVNPYMLHCHMLNHEDGGLMGQFIVTSAATETLAVASFTRTGGNSLINFQFNTTPGTSFLAQYSPDMTTGSWTTIGTTTGNSDGSGASFTEDDVNRLALPRGFYRAVLQSVVTPPVITSGATVTPSPTHGVFSSNIYTITASNGPTGYGAILDNLTGTPPNLVHGPGGLTINPNTGVISGTPTTAGTYIINVMASNSGGTTHKTVTLTVQ